MCKFYRNFLGTISTCLILLCISGCGKKGTVAVTKKEISPRKECANWCKKNSIKLRYVKTNDEVNVLAERSFTQKRKDSGHIDFTKENNKQIPQDPAILLCSLDALGKYADFITHIKKIQKNTDEKNVISSTYSLQLGDICIENYTKASQLNENEEKLTAQLYKKISVKQQERILLEYELGGTDLQLGIKEEKNKRRFTNNVGNLQDLQAILSKNNIYLNIRYVAWNPKEIAIVFTMQPVLLTDKR